MHLAITEMYTSSGVSSLVKLTLQIAKTYQMGKTIFKIFKIFYIIQMTYQMIHEFSKRGRDCLKSKRLYSN